MNFISMQGKHDCGPVAIANLLSVAQGHDPDLIYRSILRDWDFPGTPGLLQDLWDSPARHQMIVEYYSGRRVGTCAALPCPGALREWTTSAPRSPSVVLLRLGLQYHWVTAIDDATWHDGKGLRTDDWSTVWPGIRVVLAYRIGGLGRWPWWHWPWYYLTSLFT
jgi:hypothetical protein